MAIEGPLRELALSDVFQLLDLSRKTGVLSIRRDQPQTAAEVRFDRGAVVGTKMEGDGGQIGHLLLRAGKVTEAEIELARREQRARQGRPLGLLLVEMGIVSAADVQRQLRFQIEEAVSELIRWKEGYFHFEENPAAGEAALPVRVSTESLLMEAARRIDEMSTLEGSIPHLEVIPALLGAGEAATLELHPQEWEVLAEIDGRRSLKRIASDLGCSDFEVAKVVYGLVSTKVVEILREAATGNGNGRAAEPVDDGLDEVRGALKREHPHRALRLLETRIRERPDAAGMVLLARALGVLGRHEDARRALLRATVLDPLSATAHYELALAAVRLGDLPQAADAWDTYLRLPPGEPARRARAVRGRAAAASLRGILQEERQ